MSWYVILKATIDWSKRNQNSNVTWRHSSTKYVQNNIKIYGYQETIYLKKIGKNVFYVYIGARNKNNTDFIIVNAFDTAVTLFSNISNIEMFLPGFPKYCNLLMACRWQVV